MRITSKGQVTIPKHVRDRLGLAPGDDVGFREEGQAVYVVNESGASTSREREEVAKNLVRRLQSFGRNARRMPMTDQELMELTRGPFNDLDAD
jgi:AbrB family looped-hinge helix DNA binding protein